MNKSIIIWTIIIVIALGVGAWFYFGNSSTSNSQMNLPGAGAAMNNPTPENATATSPSPALQSTSTSQTTKNTTSTNQKATSQKDFTIIGQNYSLTPSTITVNKGDDVKITFKNTDGFHGLKIDEFGVTTGIIPAGGKATIEFIADKTGTFEYYCPVDSHKELGMKGTLTVK